MRTPAQLRLRLAGPMSGYDVADVVDQLLASGCWLISDLEFSGSDVRVVVRYLMTGEEFTLTARKVAA